MKPYFECTYCLKKYTSEPHFKKHECKEMRVHKLLNSPLGLAAYDCYCTWRKANGYAEISKERFGESKLLTSFVKFIKFANRVALPHRERFIKYMVELTVHPKDWTNNMIYEHYLEKFDVLVPPREQADQTVQTFYELSSIFNCTLPEVYDHMEPDTLTRLVQARKLSPWILMFSRGFHLYMRHSMTREQRALLETHVDAKQWKDKFEKYPKLSKFMRDKVADMGI